ALAHLLPRDRLRETIRDGGTLPPEVWSAMVELGWPALLVPEAFGGLGRGLVDMTVVAEEMGRLPMPGPFFSSAILATLAATRLGAGDLLAGLASGEQRGTVAIEEAGTSGDPLGAIRTTASRSGDGWVLDGVKPVVLDAATANWVLVAATDLDGLAAFLVTAPPAQRVPGMDPGRDLARVTLTATPARRIGPPGDQTPTLRRVVDDASVLLCAELVGCCDQAVARSTEYAKTRVQFGRPIGTFQAVKHLAADMVRATTLARVGTHYAAWASDTDAADREVAAAMAKSWVSEAAISVTADTIQVHGGVGFTWECDAHLFYKRAKAADLTLGRQGWQRRRVADLLLGPPPDAPVLC
ncbi:MAG: acyl-CoA dehydrogenase family protein, partial [Mycobacteriales bacterium]